MRFGVTRVRNESAGIQFEPTILQKSGKGDREQLTLRLTAHEHVHAVYCKTETCSNAILVFLCKRFLSELDTSKAKAHCFLVEEYTNLNLRENLTFSLGQYQRRVQE